MILYDNIAEGQITFDAAKRTKDGYLAASARVARTGIQVYTGRECGRPEMEFVRVYRPESEVFKADALKTFAHRPITDDHPHTQVTADNWKHLSKGHTGEEIVRDGRFIRVPMLLMDGPTIKKWEDGKRELSMGYSCDLDFKDGVTEDGEEYDAVQTNIRANHLALVKKARGGEDLRVGDEDDAGWDPDKHPRHPAGSEAGGEFAPAEVAQERVRVAVNKLYKIDPHKDPDKFQELLAQEKEARTELESEALKEIEASGFQMNSKKQYFINPNEKGHTLQIYPYSEDVPVFNHQYPGERKWNEGKLSELGKYLKSLKKRRNDSADNVHAADDLDNVDNNTGELTMRIMVDGIALEMADKDGQIVQRALDAAKKAHDELFKSKEELEKEAEEKKKKYETDSATSATQIATLTTENATLKKQIGDSAITPAKLDALVKDRMVVVDKAKIILGNGKVDLKLSDAEIRRACVDHHVGEAAKGWSDEAVAAAFTAIPVKTGDGVRKLANSFDAQPRQQDMTVLDTAHANYEKHLREASQPSAAA